MTRGGGGQMDGQASQITRLASPDGSVRNRHDARAVQACANACWSSACFSRLCISDHASESDSGTQSAVCPLIMPSYYSRLSTLIHVQWAHVRRVMRVSDAFSTCIYSRANHMPRATTSIQNLLHHGPAMLFYLRSTAYYLRTCDEPIRSGALLAKPPLRDSAFCNSPRQLAARHLSHKGGLSRAIPACHQCPSWDFQLPGTSGCAVRCASRSHQHQSRPQFLLHPHQTIYQSILRHLLPLHLTCTIFLFFFCSGFFLPAAFLPVSPLPVHFAIAIAIPISASMSHTLPRPPATNSLPCPALPP